MIDRVIESKTGDFYKITDSIIENGTTKYLTVNLKTKLFEILEPISIIRFIDPTKYLFLNNKFIIDSDHNVIKELRNKINFKTSFDISKNVKIDTILDTDVLIDDEVYNILVSNFKIYLEKDICKVRKIVSSVKIKNKIETEL